MVINHDYLKVWVNPLLPSWEQLKSDDPFYPVMKEVLTKLVPIPQKVGNDGHYPKFEDVYGKPGNHDIPILPVKPKRFKRQKHLQPKSQHVSKVRKKLKCTDCGKASPNRLMVSPKFEK